MNMTRATEYRLMVQKNKEVKEHYSALLVEYLKKEGKNYMDTYFNFNADKLTLRWFGKLEVKDLQFLMKIFGDIESLQASHQEIVIVFRDDD